MHNFNCSVNTNKSKFSIFWSAAARVIEMDTCAGAHNQLHATSGEETLLTFCMHQMCCQLRNWWTKQKSSSLKHMVRRKVLIFLCLLFCECTCNYLPCTSNKKIHRDTPGSFHLRACFCCAQRDIMLILMHTGWRDWINIGYTIHLTYDDSFRMIWKWLRSKMEWIFNLYHHIMMWSCFLVKTTKTEFMLAAHDFFMMSHSNLPEK